jgi:hypothetical protein
MGSSHPFFVSITEVEYSSKTKELGIATKFFPDDLEEALRKFSGKKSVFWKSGKLFFANASHFWYGGWFPGNFPRCFICTSRACLSVRFRRFEARQEVFLGA